MSNIDSVCLSAKMNNVDKSFMCLNAKLNNFDKTLMGLMATHYVPNADKSVICLTPTKH